MTREPLTLASASPRRRQLLEMLGIPVRVVPSNVPEVRRPLETALDYVERLAREKAASVAGRLVLGADTTVIVRDEVLEKPVDEADALRMLLKLQGRTHQVVTSVALVERIEGDFFCVMGLPLRLVLRLLEEAGEKYEFGTQEAVSLG